MPLFSYETEEEKRRRRMLPTEEDYPGAAPPALPEISSGRPPMMAAGNPGAISPPTFPSRRPSRLEEMNEARDVYMQKTPGRLKAGLLGGLQALSGGGGQDIGQAVGQGLGGLIGGLINPRGVRETQFNQRVRPQIMDRFAAEDAERAAARQAEQDALGVELKRAQIGATNRQNLPSPPRPLAPIRSDRGLYDPEARGIIPGTEPLPQGPKTPAPNWVETNRGFVNLNDPKTDPSKVQRRREPKGAGGGGSGGRDTKARERAVMEFNNAKQALVDAVARGDEDTAFDLRTRLNSMVTNIASKYGDQIEVGGGDWPYIKQRGQQSAAPSQPASQGKMSRKSAKQKLIANGYSSAEADKELNRLGIR